jgi:multidrug efflux pump subunit AcrB
VLALAGMKLVPQQFFPNSSRPELILDLRMKEGSSFQATTEQVKRMEAVLKKDEDVSSSPPTPAPARRASTSRCRPSCPTRATRSSS